MSGNAITKMPLMSENLNDLIAPGVAITVEPDIADSLGFFEESAITPGDAWESNIDILLEEF